MKKFSFVIPAYNSSELLLNTLEALNLQEGFNRNDYEVVVVDDGSEEDTLSLIKNLRRNYEIKYLYLERGPLSCAARARNFGWKNALGEIVVFIDGDILVKPYFLKELERLFTLTPDVVVIGTRLMLKEPIARKRIADGSFFEEYRNAVANLELHEFRYKVFNDYSYNASTLIYPWLVSFTCNMAVPRRGLETVGGFDENFLAWGLEDVELAYQLYREGLPTVFGYRLEVFHQFHGAGTDEITPEKYAGIEKNVRHFITKHPGAMDLPEASIYDLFKGKLKFNHARHQGGFTAQHVIDYKERELLPEVKDTVMSLSAKPGLEIIVNDYREDSDLDLWIQSLGPRNSTPKYFPRLSRPPL